MNYKTIETSLLYLAGGCLVISVLEIITRGFGFAYIWLMISVMLWLGFIFVRKKATAEDKKSKGQKSKKATLRKSAQGSSRTSAATTSSESKSRRNRR